jgi:maltooligosyltrehalose trehalohydrolase
MEHFEYGAIAAADGGVRWTVWAPNARAVELVLLDPGGRRTIPMTAAGRGHWTHAAADVPDGQRYAYRLDGGPDRPDPASRWQPDGVADPSAVVRPGIFRWTDAGWRGVAREDLVIYELHVGTFTPAGTFDAVVPRLPELRELGVTAVELMPVAQFPGGRNWGYDGVLPFAVQDSYGGPDGLRRLIDAAHAQGLAVLIDAVYNHVGPEGNYLGEFGPYFTDRYKTPWGSAVNFDGPGSDAVRGFVLQNARMWVAEYHADGLRLDACHAIYDTGATHILQEVGEVARAAAGGRAVHVIAESDLNDARLLLPADRGGYGLDGQWADDFHHAVHVHLTGERHGYYADFGGPDDLPGVLADPYLYAGRYSPCRDRRHGGPSAGLPGDRFVVCVQNHDQVGNRARGDRLAALVPPAAARQAAALLLLAPYPPLLFMGEEYGETNPFPFLCSFADAGLVEAVRRGRRAEFASFAWQGEVPDPQAEGTFRSAVLSWRWDDPTRAGLRRLYADLLAARRAWPPLRDFVRRTASRTADGTVLELTRGAGGELRAAFNLTDRPVPWSPGGTVLFRSEAGRYGGPPGEGGGGLRPRECAVVGPAGWPRYGA